MSKIKDLTLISYNSMKNRCTNKKHPSYKNYGGRGIFVCEAWLDSYECFLKDMGPRPTSQHTIDRLNVDGNYEPSNCKWSTFREQIVNQRRIKKPFGFDCMKSLFNSVGITPKAVWYRMKMGMSFEDAVFTPKKVTSNNGAKKSKPIIYLGVRYSSIDEAARKCQKDRRTILKKCEYV